MKLTINRIRAIVFMIAAFGYLPLQSAEHAPVKKDIKSDVKIERVDKVKDTSIVPVVDLIKH